MKRDVNRLVRIGVLEVQSYKNVGSTCGCTV